MKESNFVIHSVKITWKAEWIMIGSYTKQPDNRHKTTCFSNCEAKVQATQKVKARTEWRVIKLTRNKIGRKNDQSKMHCSHGRMFGICRELYKVVQFSTGELQKTKSKLSPHILLGMLTGSVGRVVRRKNPASKDREPGSPSHLRASVCPMLSQSLHASTLQSLHTSHPSGVALPLDDIWCKCFHFPAPKSQAPPSHPRGLRWREHHFWPCLGFQAWDHMSLVSRTWTFFFLWDLSSLCKNISCIWRATLNKTKSFLLSHISLPFPPYLPYVSIIV